MSKRRARGPKREKVGSRPLPAVSSSKVVEAASRAIFESVVQPWLVTHWDRHDYGIDAIVEIATPQNDSSELQATGKRFAVQLKSTADPDNPGLDLDVPVTKVRYWLQSTEPVLLISCHIR